MFNIISVVFKYIFIIIIYFFIYSIIRLIYLDIRGLSFITDDKSSYIRLLNDPDELDYLIKEYYLLNRDLSMGRSFNNDIILENPYISKRHLNIVNKNDKYYLRDLNSANGSFLNGKKVLGEVELNNGDVIMLGDIKFEFRDR